MRRAALVLALLIAAPSRARGDSLYDGVGIGTAAPRGELAQRFSADGEVGGRAHVGWRRDDVAIEGSFFGTDLHTAGGKHAGYSTLSFAAGVKGYAPITPVVALFARAALDYTWLVANEPGGVTIDSAGPGWDLGTGVEAAWRWTVPQPSPLRCVGTSLWLDAGIQHMHLRSPDAPTIDGGLAEVTLGFSFDASW